MELNTLLNPLRRVAVWSYPTRYVIVEDAFRPEVYDLLCARHEQLRGKPTRSGPVGGPRAGSTLEGLAIDGGDLSRYPLSIIGSSVLQAYLAGFTGLAPNDHVMAGIQRRPPATRREPVHTEWSIVSMPRRGGDTKPAVPGQLQSWQEGCVYGDDSADRQPNTVKMGRAMACVMFLDNGRWSAGDGGEITVESPFEEGSPAVSRFAPIDNTILAFETGPLSDRSIEPSTRPFHSYVWWYHASMPYLEARHGREQRFRTDTLQRPAMDWWTPSGGPRWSGSAFPGPLTPKRFP